MHKDSNKIRRNDTFWWSFYIMNQLDLYLSQTIDARLGIRSTQVGYQYSEINRALFCIYFCGGECVEDVSSYLKSHLLLRPHIGVLSSDTILRGISELSTAVLFGLMIITGTVLLDKGNNFLLINILYLH